MGKYRKKRVEIEAVQFDGHHTGEIHEFCGDCFYEPVGGVPFITTLEGNMNISKGDYIIKGVKGEFYPCKPDIFEQTYDSTSGCFCFSIALEAARSGKKIARTGWNGKNMYVTLKRGYPDGVPCNAETARAHGIPEGTKIVYLPYLEMKTATGALVPWLISQTDALADDWYIVE